MSSSNLHRSLSVGLAVVAIIGAAAIWIGTDVASRLSASTETVSRAAEVLDESIDTADTVLASIGDGLQGADLIVADIAASAELTAQVIDDASILLTADVADSVESIERALPGLIEAGRVIDNTLSTLEFFGVSYDSDVPFGEALVEVQSSISGLDDELRLQGAGLGELSEPVRGAGDETAALAAVLGDVQRALLDAQAQLADYRTSTAELRVVADSASLDPGVVSAVGSLFAVSWAVTGILASALVWRRIAAGS